MRNLFKIILLLVALLGLTISYPTDPVSAQGYSGAPPNVSAATGTSLRATYTAGIIARGGSSNAIVADATGVLTTASQASCDAPAFTGCNFIYWPGTGTALLSTTSYATAYTSGNVVVAFVTTSTDDILTIIPASWNLPSTGGTSGEVSTTGSYVFGARSCFGGVSGNGDTGNATYALGGTSLHPEFQLLTTNSGTNTHTYQCDITPPSFITSGRGATITSVEFYYGVQTTNLGTQVATLASGTMNSQVVFTYVDYPAAAGAATPSVEAPVRADSGTLVIAPVVASANVATTTAGRYYTVSFTPASGIVVETARRQYYLNVALLNTATSATETNTVGGRVVYSILR